MFYEVTTGQEYPDIPQFLNKYPHTQFGDLYQETVRNQVGLYTISVGAKPTFNKLTQTVVEDGVTLVDGLYFRAWKIVPLSEAEKIDKLNQARQLRIEEIKSIRDNITQNGGYKVNDKWFHQDTFSRTQQMGLMLLGTNIPAGLLWKTMDGQFVEMTPTLAQQVFSAAAIQDTNTFANAENLIGLINNSADPYAVNIKQGWPETFGPL